MLTYQYRSTLLQALRHDSGRTDMDKAVYLIKYLPDAAYFAYSVYNAYAKIQQLEGSLAYERQSRSVLDEINAELHAKMHEQQYQITQLAAVVHKYDVLVHQAKQQADQLHVYKLKCDELNIQHLEQGQLIYEANESLTRVQQENQSLTGYVASLQTRYYSLVALSAQQHAKLVQYASYMGLYAQALITYISETTNLRYAVTNCLVTLYQNEMLVSNLKSHSRTLETDFTQVVAALVYTQKTATDQQAALQLTYQYVLNQRNQMALYEINMAYASEAVFAELYKTDLYLHQCEAQINTLKGELYYRKDENEALIYRQNYQAQELYVKNCLLDEIMAQNRQLLVDNDRLLAENSQMTHQIAINASYYAEAQSQYPLRSYNAYSASQSKALSTSTSSNVSVYYQTREYNDNTDDYPITQPKPDAFDRQSISYAANDRSIVYDKISGMQQESLLLNEEEEASEQSTTIESPPVLKQALPEQKLPSFYNEPEIQQYTKYQNAEQPVKPSEQTSIYYEELHRQPSVLHSNSQLQPVFPIAPERAEPELVKPPVADMKTRLRRPPKHPVKKPTEHIMDILNLDQTQNLSRNYSQLPDISLLGEDERKRADLNMVDSRFEIQDDPAADTKEPDTYQDLDKYITKKERARLEAQQPFDADVSINYESIMEVREEYNPHIIADYISAHYSMLDDDVDAMVSTHDNNADRSITYVDGVYFGNMQKNQAPRDTSAIQQAANTTINSFIADYQNIKAKRKAFYKKSY